MRPGPSCGLLTRRREPPQQSDLPRVIQVMCGNAADRVQRGTPLLRVVAKSFRQFENHAPQILMLSHEQLDILPPRRFRTLQRPFEKIAALEGKAASLLSGKPPSHHIFPIRRVYGEFPDIVTSCLRPPCRLRCGDTPDRAPQVRPVP